jgi:lipoprotein-anchoring transpeptidase ErfK/SrfK
VIEPKNATLIYSCGAFRIIKEVYGSKVKEKRLYTAIKNYLMCGKKELDLDGLKCYYSPGIRSDSLKVLNTETVANRYLDAKIIYSYDGGRTIIDKEEISQWIEFDNDLDIKFNYEKIKGFVSALAYNYNTYAKFRDFKTSAGKTIQVGGGDYGWLVDIEGETRDITDAIVYGKTIFKEPKYSQKGAVYGRNDIGQTYVEINLSKQHLWYYKDGKLIDQGYIVSGDVNDGYKTPEGIYSLKFKIRNAVLEGENYQAKVSYWMPFNKDIGIHDANWRSSFGGKIYLTSGSHGCINAPFRLAEILYNNISVGTPIICYY